MNYDEEAEVARLAGLSDVQYDREREEAAQRLGIQLKTLDRIVREKRPQTEVADGLQGKRVMLAETDPWPEPVDGEHLVEDLVTAIRRHVVLAEYQALGVALWVVHAHALDAAEHSARLHIASPEKRCGKSTLLSTIEPIVPKALGTENISTAALYRVIEMHRPTLLIDEVDLFLKSDSEMRGMLNAGHRRGGAVIRSVGDDHEPRQFSVWGPVVLAGIGSIPSTIEDRSITINLRPASCLQRRSNDCGQAGAIICMTSAAKRRGLSSIIRSRLVLPTPRFLTTLVIGLRITGAR